jgi:hypothetical protein
MTKAQVVTAIDQIMRTTRRIEHLTVAIAALVEIGDEHLLAIAQELSRERDEQETIRDRHRRALSEVGDDVTTPHTPRKKDAKG